MKNATIGPLAAIETAIQVECSNRLSCQRDSCQTLTTCSCINTIRRYQVRCMGKYQDLGHLTRYTGASKTIRMLFRHLNFISVHMFVLYNSI